MVVGGHLGWTGVVSEGAGARPSQLIASVGPTRMGGAMDRRRLTNLAALTIPLTVVLGVLAVDAVSRTQETGTAGDEAAIRMCVGAIRNAINKRDFGAYAAQFADDGDLVVLSNAKVGGRAAIQQASQTDWSAAPPARQIELRVDELRFLSPDVALVNATATFSAGEPTATRPTYIVVRRGGQWVVAAMRVLPAVSQ
jgi:uncharacterized protein (TIGR02246 family)